MGGGNGGQVILNYRKPLKKMAETGGQYTDKKAKKQKFPLKHRSREAGVFPRGETDLVGLSYKITSVAVWALFARTRLIRGSHARTSFIHRIR